MAKIYHSDLYGKRESKYKWLDENSFSSIEWNELNPNSPKYFFIPRDEQFKDIYKSFVSVQEILQANSVGIVTARDHLTIEFFKDKLWSRIKAFIKMDIETARIAFNLRKDVRDWKVKNAQKDIIDSGTDYSKLRLIYYRPFDKRWTYYTGNSRGFIGQPCFPIMKNMLSDNLSLVICRQQNKVGFKHCFISDILTESCLVSNKTREINYIFPLYLYPDTDKKDLFSEHESEEKKPNINPELFETLKTNFSKSPRLSKERGRGEVETSPEEIFYYIYAVLYSNTYRTKYAEFLKIDFPRVPFTKNYQLFLELGKLGKQLADLHLLKEEAFRTTISKFPIEGTNKVEKPKYKEEKVYINNDQYFDGVKEEIWNYQIGGYQVCEKWLKDRKERTLTLEEIQTYSKIVTALSKTIEIQNQIDELYPKVEKTL
jgi:predicted helicase